MALELFYSEPLPEHLDLVREVFLVVVVCRVLEVLHAFYLDVDSADVSNRLVYQEVYCACYHLGGVVAGFVQCHVHETVLES